MYPQYAASTTASALDQVAEFLRRTRNVPEIRLVKHFSRSPFLCRALANLVQEHWRLSGRPDKLVMSFHGLPRFSLARGDPYHSECHETAHLLAGRLELSESEWQITFQSRFGRAEWIEPTYHVTRALLADYRPEWRRLSGSIHSARPKRDWKVICHSLSESSSLPASRCASHGTRYGKGRREQAKNAAGRESS